MTPGHLIYRLATVDEIMMLRSAVLRPNEMPAKLEFPADHASIPATWHFGAFTPAGLNIACLTLLNSSWEGQSALQLRGMAVADSHRNAGIGALLLQTAAAAIAAHPLAKSWTWWCNARVAAIPFYQRNGWNLASDEFMIESVGPHRKMIRALPHS